MIVNFKREHRFLSMSYPAVITYNGIVFYTAEAAYQAQKTTSPREQEKMSTLGPEAARRRGEKIPLRPDWEKVKGQIMYEIQFAKFSQNRHLKEKLLSTAGKILVDTDYDHGPYWAEIRGEGENNLGKILMKVREDLE